MGFFVYAWQKADKELDVVKAELQSAQVKSDQEIKKLQQDLDDAVYENIDLADKLSIARDRAEDLQDQFREISGVVVTLEKIRRTDPELLQKYSKVYFLNEHYLPAKLANIDSQYLYRQETPLLINADINPFLNRLLTDASDDDINLLIISAFRSFGVQESLKTGYKVIYGAGTANQFSADQGYSEHQLGTTIDFTTPEVAGTFVGFEEAPAYEWLQDNAHRYGFVLSYPDGNAYYQFEPWHWRFVGVDLATELKKQGKFFYDLDQREINEYLGVMFD